MKKVIVSATSDLVTDQRVHKTCMTLSSAGYNVLLIGRKLTSSLLLEEREYSTRRFKLFFQKGPFFYIEFTLHLFFYLLFNKVDILLSNDLDTLLPNFLISKIKRVKLVYDNHEYYTGVPELQKRPFIRAVWKTIERLIFPQLPYVYTVNESIADLYRNEYNIEVKVVRNLPRFEESIEMSERPKEFPVGKKIILYQGAGINMDRGLEETIEAMKFIDLAVLVVIGGGDLINELKTSVIKKGLSSKIIFIPKLPFQLLKKYTSHADIGLSLDKDTNINYRFSLPNKIFDYIHAGVPVLASPLIEVKKTIENYAVGSFIENHQAEHIAEKIKMMLADLKQMETWKQNCRKAAQSLNWQNEEKTILKIFQTSTNSV